jgi:hypothetical protein
MTEKMDLPSHAVLRASTGVYLVAPGTSARLVSYARYVPTRRRRGDRGISKITGSGGTTAHDIFCANTAGFTACADNSSIDNGFDTQLTSIEMKAGLDSNTGLMTAWTDVVFNLNNGTGTALITATDNFNHQFTYTISNGENKGLLQVVTDRMNSLPTSTFQSNKAPPSASTTSSSRRCRAPAIW